MKPVREIVSRDIIEDLWGAGYTILPRARHPDPFYLPAEMIPASRSYQWMHLVQDTVYIQGGWSPVPASRHDGYFMPAGHIGDIEVSGLGLFEKPKFEVDAERGQQIAAAHKQVDDLKEKWEGCGFSGSFNVGDEKADLGVQPAHGSKVPSSKAIELTTSIPRDMVPYMELIFAERDALYEDLVSKWNSGQELNEQQDVIRKIYEAAIEDDPETLKGPALNALLLPIAIENVRNGRYGEDNAKAS